ncbi:MAG: hypothetical protein M1130_10085 [Actinobacteria bacterium]|nr:hypothetical protein [Actinomycetota bacterium]
MLAKKAEISECDVVIVDKCEIMRNTLKSMIVGNMYVIHEAIDETGAINIALRHNPRIIFVSMEDNQYWPGLVQNLKRNSECTVVAYSTGITRDAVAQAYFAGVDDILVNPQNQKERVEKYIMKSEGVNSDRYYKFPNHKSTGGYSHLKKFFWLQAE